MYHRILFYTVIFLAPQALSAFQLGNGLAALDEGDDRIRPAARVNLGIGESFTSYGYYYGRKYGPVHDQGILLSMNYRFYPSGTKTSGFSASVGTVGMRESTTIKPDPADQEGKIDEKRLYNFGMALGLGYDIRLGPLCASFNWDSNLFAAGSAAIFLVTARKQFISFSTGIYL